MVFDDMRRHFIQLWRIGVERNSSSDEFERFKVSIRITDENYFFRSNLQVLAQVFDNLGFLFFSRTQGPDEFTGHQVIFDDELIGIDEIYPQIMLGPPG